MGGKGYNRNSSMEGFIYKYIRDWDVGECAEKEREPTGCMLKTTGISMSEQSHDSPLLAFPYPFLGRAWRGWGGGRASGRWRGLQLTVDIWGLRCLCWFGQVRGKMKEPWVSEQMKMCWWAENTLQNSAFFFFNYYSSIERRHSFMGFYWQACS